MHLPHSKYVELIELTGLESGFCPGAWFWWLCWRFGGGGRRGWNLRGWELGFVERVWGARGVEVWGGGNGPRKISLKWLEEGAVFFSPASGK